MDNQIISIIRKALKISWLIFVAIAAIISAAALIIQLPRVQTFIIGKVVESLDDRLDADISFEKIHFQPFKTLLVKNVMIIDRNPAYDAADSTAARVDTFFRAGYITARFRLDGLIKHQGIHLDEAVIEDAQMNLVLEDKPDMGDGDTSTDNLSRIFRIKKAEVPRRSEKEIFHIKSVKIKDMGFSMKNYGIDKIPYHGGINWDDLDVKDINLSVSELQFKAGIMSGKAESLSFREKSGYRTEFMSGIARVGRGKTIVENLNLDDPWSDLDLPLYMMSYDNIKAFSDFISKVKIDATIADSRLDFRTLKYFAPQLEGNGLKAVISGTVSGYVDDFNVRNVKITASEDLFSGSVNGTMKGLPDIGNTSIDATVKGLNFDTEGLGGFLTEWSRGKEVDLSRFARGIIFMTEASAEGQLDDLDINADISSFIGRLKADANIGGVISKDRPLSIKGTVSTQNFDIGKAIGSDIVGPVTLLTSIDARMPDDITLDSLVVYSLNFNGYDYQDITVTGVMEDNELDGKIAARDPNLNALVQVKYRLSSRTKKESYELYANVQDSDLYAMNIDKRGKSKLRFTTYAKFEKNDNGDSKGFIDIADLILTNKDSTSVIGDLNLKSQFSDETYRMSLSSQFADGSYTGTAPITRFAKDLISLTAGKELPAMYDNTVSEWQGDSYKLDIQTHDTRKILAFILPGAYIHNGTTLHLDIDKEGALTTTLNSQRIAMKANNFRDIRFRADNLNGNFSGEMTSETGVLAGFTLNDNLLKFLADDNHIGLSYSYDNHSDMENRGELVVNGDLSREDGELGVGISLLPSTLYFNSRDWSILPSSIRMKGKEIVIDSLEATSGDQRIYAYGKTSQTAADTLTLGLDRFDLSALAPLTGPGLDLRGIATGKVSLTSPLKTRGLLADILCDSTFIAGEPLGTLTLGSVWNEEFERFDISVKNSHLGKSNLNATAKFTPKSKMLDAALTLDSLNIKYAEPFLTDVFSEMEGYVSGDIIAEGPVNLLEIKSSGTRLDKAMLKVAFTNVPYYADGSFHIDDTGVWFDDISIRDRYNGTGTVEGSINWSQFKDITFDTRLKVRNIEGIDLTEKMNEDFYGNIYGTGNVSITGPVNSLVLTVDAVTAKTGQLHIPMSGAATSGGATNLLKFKEPVKETYIDPYEAMMARIDRKEQGKSDFLVKLRVEASPNVIAFVEIDKASGNVLSGQGNGLIELEAGDDIFNINGDYTLTGGKYNFSALGLVNRVFDIQDGSSINFSGDIMQSTLDIDAVYKTKASLSSLLSDESSVANRRNVECGIRITDKISNPRLEFFIDVPDLNPMIKSRVESALSTEDKIQKQFLSLLLSNSFLPDEQSGIVNNSSMFYSNVTEAMANQLSNILHKLDIPLDLGLKYQPTDQGTDIFDVAVSTQLFNNRVVVNGNIGNKQYEGGGAQNDVVGDLDIEIKLNRSGAFRLNIFSHSADQYSNYLDNSQRNGVGLTYQTEFNSFRQFFRNLFSGKQKRQEARLAEQQELISGERVEFSIKEEDNRKSDLKKNDRK